MNLVMAVLVEGALSQASADRELKDQMLKDGIRARVPIIEQVFSLMDCDGNGVITCEEISKLRVDELPQDFMKMIDLDTVRELFEMLDVEQTGEVTKEEFIDGVLSLSLSENLENLQLLKLLRVLRMDVARVERLLPAAPRTQLRRERRVPTYVRSIQPYLSRHSGLNSL